jgi:hypothetical protein
MAFKWIILIMTFTLYYASASESIAIIKSVQGEAFIKRNQSIITIHKGEDILSSDIIQTKTNATVGLSFNDGTLISVGPKSTLVIEEYLFDPYKSNYRFDLSLKKGTAAFESGKIGKLAPEKVHFKVSQGVIGIRGTKFLVEAE